MKFKAFAGIAERERRRKVRSLSGVKSVCSKKTPTHYVMIITMGGRDELTDHQARTIYRLQRKAKRVVKPKTILYHDKLKRKVLSNIKAVEGGVTIHLLGHGDTMTFGNPHNVLFESPEALAQFLIDRGLPHDIKIKLKINACYSGAETDSGEISFADRMAKYFSKNGYLKITMYGYEGSVRDHKHFMHSITYKRLDDKAYRPPAGSLTSDFKVVEGKASAARRCFSPAEHYELALAEDRRKSIKAAPAASPGRESTSSTGAESAKAASFAVAGAGAAEYKDLGGGSAASATKAMYDEMTKYETMPTEHGVAAEPPVTAAMYAAILSKVSAAAAKTLDIESESHGDASAASAAETPCDDI